MVEHPQNKMKAEIFELNKARKRIAAIFETNEKRGK